MKKRVISWAVVAFLSFNLLGCAPIFIVSAAVGALGGYAASKDTIQGETDKNYEAIWNSALSVAKIRGTVKYEDSMKGYLEFEAESSKVYVRLLRLTQATTRVRVSARKYHLPNLTLAQDIFVKVMEETK